MTEEKTPAQIVDELGLLKAQIADLTKQETALKAKLAGCGLRAIDGDYYSATVTSRDTIRLESEKVRAILSPAQVIACSKTTTSTVVSVTARISRSKAQ